MVESHPKAFGVSSSGHGACEFAFLTSSQVMLMLLVQDRFQEPLQCESSAAQTLLSIKNHLESHKNTGVYSVYLG